MTRIITAPRKLAVAIGTSAILMFALSSAGAQDAIPSDATGRAMIAAVGHVQATSPGGQPGIAKSSKRYFIEFRARAAKSYGHAYVIYGTVNVAVVAIVTFASLLSAVVRSARTQIALNQHGVRTPRHNRRPWHRACS